MTAAGPSLAMLLQLWPPTDRITFAIAPDPTVEAHMSDLQVKEIFLHLPCVATVEWLSQ